jgi:hypothetical protein
VRGGGGGERTSIRCVESRAVPFPWLEEANQWEQIVGSRGGGEWSFD